MGSERGDVAYDVAYTTSKCSINVPRRFGVQSRGPCVFLCNLCAGHPHESTHGSCGPQVSFFTAGHVALFMSLMAGGPAIGPVRMNELTLARRQSTIMMQIVLGVH